MYTGSATELWHQVEAKIMSINIFESQQPLTEENILTIEKILWVKIPNEYRFFLLKNNGGWPEPEGFDIQWIEDRFI